MNTLYHATTPAKAKRYHESGRIIAPVRGFTTLQAAMAWSIKTGRKVIYEVNTSLTPHKLPDHHNIYGTAMWVDGDIPIGQIHCIFSADSDA